MKTYFDFVAQTKTLLATFVLTFLFLLVVFPQLAGDIESLDVRTGGYSYADVMAAMEGYGEAGRTRYAWISPTLDTLFPLCYVSLYAGVLWRFAPHERLKAMAYLPVIGGVFDLGENAQVVTMLLQYPDITVAQVEWANRFTLTKFAFSRLSLFLGIVALIWAAVGYGWQRWQARQQQG